MEVSNVGNSGGVAASSPVAFAVRLSPADQAPMDRPAPSAQTVATAFSLSKRDAHPEAPLKESDPASISADTTPSVLAALPRNDVAAAVTPGVSQATHLNNPVALPAAPHPAAPHDDKPLAGPLTPDTAVSPAGTHVNNMTVRISAPETPVVDVQLNQRQGQVYIAVRTADESLQASLRQDLPQLVNSLDRAGFRAETFVPHASVELAVAASAESSFGNSPHDAPRDSRQDAGTQYENQQQQQQRQRDRMHQSWRETMED